MKFIDIKKAEGSAYTWIASFEYKRGVVLELPVYSPRKNVSRKKMVEKALEEVKRSPVGYAIKGDLKAFKDTEFELCFFKQNVKPPKSKKAAWNSEYREQMEMVKDGMDLMIELVPDAQDRIKELRRELREAEENLADRRERLKEAKKEFKQLLKLKGK